MPMPPNEESKLDMKAAWLFEGSLEWLRNRYPSYRFFTERDIVWTVQMHISQEIDRLGLPYQVFNDHTIMGRKQTDLAILDGEDIEVAAEFKYEPSHARKADRGGDIWPSKFPVVVWAGERSVEEDVQRVHQYVEQQNAKVAYSIFIDEGSYFRRRPPHPRSKWIDWGRDVSVLWSQAGR